MLTTDNLVCFSLQAAKSLLAGKATLATVGDLNVLPFAEELGLKI